MVEHPSGPELFNAPGEAARAALRRANPKSIRECIEYGGLIYRASDGRYGFSGPVPGTSTSFEPSAAPIPPGTELVGDYHTHGAYCRFDRDSRQPVRTDDPLQDDYNSDEFSDTDIDGITAIAERIDGYRGYLGTPSGLFYEYDPDTEEVSLL